MPRLLPVVRLDLGRLVLLNHPDDLPLLGLTPDLELDRVPDFGGVVLVAVVVRIIVVVVGIVVRLGLVIVVIVIIVGLGLGLVFGLLLVLPLPLLLELLVPDRDDEFVQDGHVLQDRFRVVLLPVGELDLGRLVERPAVVLVLLRPDGEGLAALQGVERLHRVVVGRHVEFGLDHLPEPLRPRPALVRRLVQPELLLVLLPVPHDEQLPGLRPDGGQRLLAGPLRPCLGLLLTAVALLAERPLHTGQGLLERADVLVDVVRHLVGQVALVRPLVVRPGDGRQDVALVGAGLLELHQVPAVRDLERRRGPAAGVTAFGPLLGVRVHQLLLVLALSHCSSPFGTLSALEGTPPSPASRSCT